MWENEEHFKAITNRLEIEMTHRGATTGHTVKLEVGGPGRGQQRDNRQESEQLGGESWLHASRQRELGKPQLPHLQNGSVRPATAKGCCKDEMTQNDQMEDCLVQRKHVKIVLWGVEQIKWDVAKGMARKGAEDRRLTVTRYEKAGLYEVVGKPGLWSCLPSGSLSLPPSPQFPQL